jgi:hypothetical protein
MVALLAGKYSRKLPEKTFLKANPSRMPQQSCFARLVVVVWRNCADEQAGHEAIVDGRISEVIGVCAY